MTAISRGRLPPAPFEKAPYRSGGRDDRPIPPKEGGLVKEETKKAVVVGASSGIGRELAKTLCANGYLVGVAARRAPLLEELCDETDGVVAIEAADVSDPEIAKNALTRLIERMGGVDLVVISAGTGRVNPDLDWALEHDAIRTNVVGFAALADVAIKYFMERGSGHLVGITSIAALRGGRHAPAYNASKAFQANYLEGLRQKVKKAGLPIAVTDIKPGFVKTAMAQGEFVFWAADADKAAMQIYRAILRKKAGAYVTRRWRSIAWIMKLLPGCLYEKL